MFSQWFATPEFLFTILAMPICSAFLMFAYRRRRQSLNQLGNVLLLRRSVLVKPRIRRWKAVCFILGLTFLGIGAAGPRWGIDMDAQLRKGRDIFVVFDLSRSMLAEQPSRRTLAVRSAKLLADGLETHGGHRVALIGFASKARLFFPLTLDYEHFRQVLKQIDAGDYAPLSQPDPVSGTRMGSALSLAVSMSDPQRVNRPVIVLLSDGDDPANDDEWRAGSDDAKAKGIRIHTVGFGNPKAAETIPVGRDVFTFDGNPIMTKLNEECLREIASQTRGRYFDAHRNAIDLGVYVQHLLDADELREEESAGTSVPVYQLRYAWPLLPAVMLLMLAIFLSEGPLLQCDQSGVRKQQPRKRSRAKAVAWIGMLLAMLCISAADPPSVESIMRLGNDAFAAQQYEEALRYYEQAEARTLDPGLVSFNKAATLYRLERYKEAIDCYRRAIEDDRAPPDRQARVHFDLGNALIQHAGDRVGPLADAIANYRRCLNQNDLSPKLRADARHNLELAQLRWLHAKKQKTADQKPPDSPQKKDPIDLKDPKQSDKEYKLVKVNPPKKTSSGEDEGPKGEKSKDLRFDRHITVLPDDSKLQAISREDALTTLEDHARRIAEERRQLRDPARGTALSTKDW